MARKKKSKEAAEETVEVAEVTVEETVEAPAEEAVEETVEVAEVTVEETVEATPEHQPKVEKEEVDEYNRLIRYYRANRGLSLAKAEACAKRDLAAKK